MKPYRLTKGWGMHVYNVVLRSTDEIIGEVMKAGGGMRGSGTQWVARDAKAGKIPGNIEAGRWSGRVVAADAVMFVHLGLPVPTYDTMGLSDWYAFLDGKTTFGFLEGKA